MFETIVNADGTISIVPVGQTNNLPFTSMATMDAANQFPILPGSSTPPLDAFKNTLAPMGVNTGIMSSSAAIPFGTPVDIAQGFTRNTPSDQGTNFQFLESANEDETDVVEDKKSGGIADLFRAILGFVVPGASFFLNQGRDALGGIRSLNQRLRNTDFGQSKTLVDYLEKRRRRKETDFLGSGDSQGDIITYDPAKTRNRQRIMNMQPTNRDTARGSIPSRSSPTTSRRDTSPSSSYSQASYARRR